MSVLRILYLDNLLCFEEVKMSDLNATYLHQASKNQQNLPLT